MFRRQFLRVAATAVVSFQIAPRDFVGRGERPPSEKLHIAGIGVGGQGSVVLHDLRNEHIVALCDVDWAKAAEVFAAFPKAERFRDYRVMLHRRRDIDAVVIATPDHMHAPIALAALHAGKHVYVEKPMAHSVEEVRRMCRVAAQKRLVTQMGNQGHAGEGLRQTREWIQAGAIGTVRQVHAWTDRAGKWWKQPAARNSPTVSVPADFAWDLWLGAASQRAYQPGCHPFAWRGWFDFGSGALGDMGIHNLEPAFYALDLGLPLAVTCESAPPGPESYPAWQILTFEFAARADRPALQVRWYDGGKLPPHPEAIGDAMDLPANGIYFVGDKGVLVCGGWSGAPQLFPERRRQEFSRPPKTIPRSPGHRLEWVQACKACNPDAAKAGFAYAGPFTEALLVGNLATRLQRRVEWDAAAMCARNAPGADGLIRKTYRHGFELA